MRFGVEKVAFKKMLNGVLYIKKKVSSFSASLTNICFHTSGHIWGKYRRDEGES